MTRPVFWNTEKKFSRTKLFLSLASTAWGKWKTTKDAYTSLADFSILVVTYTLLCGGLWTESDNLSSFLKLTERIKKSFTKKILYNNKCFECFTCFITLRVLPLHRKTEINTTSQLIGYPGCIYSLYIYMIEKLKLKKSKSIDVNT